MRKSLLKTLAGFGAIALMVAAQPAFGALQNNLTAYYNFDNNTSDSSGNGNHGNHTGGTADYAAGQIGNALLLDGCSEQVEVPETGAFDYGAAGNGMSISAWFKVNSFDSGWQALVAKGEGSEFRLHRQGGGQNLAWTSGAGGDVAIPGNVNDGAWHHILVTKDNVVGKVAYLDGVQVAANGNLGNIVDNDQNLMIGENPDAANREWDGLVDDVALWGRALTLDEAQEIHHAGLSGESLGDLIGGTDVPEPATAMILGLGVLAAGARTGRRRRQA